MGRPYADSPSGPFSQANYAVRVFNRRSRDTATDEVEAYAPADQGKGLEGVAKKARDYWNPASEILEGE